MKIIISESERGFRFKHGVYAGMIMPGKQNISQLFGETCVVNRAYGRVDLSGLNLPILRKDPQFAASTAVAEVPENSLAIHFENERICEVLEAGTYAYWAIHETHRFEPVDMADPDGANSLPPTICGIFRQSSSLWRLCLKGRRGCCFITGNTSEAWGRDSISSGGTR